MASLTVTPLTVIDILAPGVDILSTWIGGRNARNTISGTSMGQYYGLHLADSSE